MAENVVFQQVRNSKGETVFRAKFGRDKALSFRKFQGFHYIDLFDNRPKKTNRICLGLDELDFLFSIRGNLESLTSYESYILNQRSCETKGSPDTYEIYEMNCKYSGPGIYKFEGPTSTKVLIFDRLTDDAHLRVRSENLEKIVILSGT